MPHFGIPFALILSYNYLIEMRGFRVSDFLPIFV
ncbi:Uncharacterised protein [Brucella intermedia]|nr:Uncharacterised protein [Brucella intermedia]